MRDWERERDRLLKKAQGDLTRSLALLRSEDPLLSEDGFHLVADIAAGHIPELIAQYRRDDAFRYWLLELIADAGSPVAFAFLVEVLDHEDEWYRSRAAGGLRTLGTKEARRVLFERGLRTPQSEPTPR